MKVIKPKDLNVVRLGKITGTFVIYVKKINRVFLCTPTKPRCLALKIIANNITRILYLEENRQFDKALELSKHLESEYIHPTTRLNLI